MFGRRPIMRRSDPRYIRKVKFHGFLKEFKCVMTNYVLDSALAAVGLFVLFCMFAFTLCLL